MRKLVVWDCDETLWKGTLMYGDDLMLKPMVKDTLELLHTRGVVQSVASKNLKEDVLAKLEEFGISSYFLVPQADLETPKSKMVSTIKDALGLARFEDIVFVDDQLFNRCEVEDRLEGVVSCEYEDMEDVIDKYFTKETYTDEDRKRAQRYRSELERSRGADSYGDDYIAFLHSCEMEVDFFNPVDTQLPRFKDLIERANRMSALDDSFNNEMVDQMFIHHRNGLLACSVKDKYGDYGLCALAILEIYKDLVEIKGVVVSCRLQGKGIGSSLLGMIINMCKNKKITARYEETRYNAGMRNLYDWYKFIDLSHNDYNIVRFERMPGEVRLPPWLKITNKCMEI